MLITTFILTCAGWVLFRANNLNDAWYILTHFMNDWDLGRIGTEQFLLRQMPIALAGIAILEFGQLLDNRISANEFLGKLPFLTRWTAYASFVIAVIMFGVYRKSQFIYFQF